MKKYFILLLLGMWSWQLYAQSNQELAIANTLVEKGDYVNAILKYKGLIAKGDLSAELYYNLGNTYLQTDSLPEAILSYERALRIDRDDPEILNNLEIARGKVEDQVAMIPEFFLISMWKNLCQTMTANSWAIVSIVLALALLLHYYFQAYKGFYIRFRYRIITLGILIFCFILSMIAGYSRKNMDTHKRSGIIFNETFMKSGPDSRSDDLKIMRPGYKVYILDNLNGWVKVRSEDREEGWIEPQYFKII